jgi:hypothetical protein
MSNQVDLLTLISFALSTITSICAVYLAYAALKYTAKPYVRVKLLGSNTFQPNTTVDFRFQFTNIGHWYGRPTAINVIAFCNFDPRFQLIELRYGSTQTYVDSDAKAGKGNTMYLKAKGLKLTFGEEGEEVHVKAVTPRDQGDYMIRVTAYSDNGVDINETFEVVCK